MTADFIARVMREGIVDTKTYRYKLVHCQSAAGQWPIIQRLPLADLDTTAALTEWETVWEGK